LPEASDAEGQHRQRDRTKHGGLAPLPAVQDVLCPKGLEGEAPAARPVAEQV
jgi:hypothetical protein